MTSRGRSSREKRRRRGFQEVSEIKTRTEPNQSLTSAVRCSVASPYFLYLGGDASAQFRGMIFQGGKSDCDTWKALFASICSMRCSKDILPIWPCRAYKASRFMSVAISCHRNIFRKGIKSPVLTLIWAVG